MSNPSLPRRSCMGALRLPYKDGIMIRLTDNKWEEGVPSWEAPLGAK
jgi:hypothetical protein